MLENGFNRIRFNINLKSASCLLAYFQIALQNIQIWLQRTIHEEQSFLYIFWFSGHYHGWICHNFMARLPSQVRFGTVSSIFRSKVRILSGHHLDSVVQYSNAQDANTQFRSRMREWFEVCLKSAFFLANAILKTNPNGQKLNVYFILLSFDYFG
jgi:hypothetical protein